MRYVFPASIAISVGLVILLGYLVGNPELAALRAILTNWAVILAAFAVLVGLLNLIVVNFRRIQARSKGSISSLVVVVAAVATFVVGSLETVRANGEPTVYTEGSVTQLLFSSVIIASQAALASLVMVLLVAGAIRALRSRPSIWTVVFLVSLGIVLIGWLPLGFMAPVNGLRDWFINVPVSAGARGILIGVALGTVVIGLRIFTGIERPYKD